MPLQDIQIPVVTWLSPNKADQGLIELWNVEVASYVPLDIGAAHPDSRQYPNFRLGSQRAVQSDYRWVIRTWVTDETSPDWFNYALKFSAEDNAFPIFIRTYREPKTSYSPRTKGSALSAIYKLVLDDAGTGYAPGTNPNITFDTPSTAPTAVALGHGVVAPDGSISECVLDFGGAGYTGNVRFRVDGGIAEGTAYVQPTSAVLTKEDAQLYPTDSEFYGQYLQVVRVYETLPGPFLYSTKFDTDGSTLTVATRRNLCADINTDESLNAGVWTKTTKNQTDSDLICDEIVATRELPGNAMISTRVEDDGKVTTITKTMVQGSTITSNEVTSGGNWIKTHREDIDDTDIAAWKVVESRPIPGNAMPQTTFNGDYEKLVSNVTLKDSSTITPAVSEAAGVVTTVEGERVSDIVSRENVTLRTWLDKKKFSVSIPDSIIPVEFRAKITTVVESHIVAGTAAMPTLGVGEFERTEEQVDKVLKRVTVETLGNLTFPIVVTGQENSTEYGGAILDVIQTLNNSALTADEGENVVSSVMRPIGDSLMWFKTTRIRPAGDVEWPVIVGTEVDPRTGIVIGITRQVVNAGTTGGVGVDGYTDIKPLDKWRSLSIASKLDPATLPDSVTWETTVEHSFPNTLVAVAFIWAAATSDCCYDFDAALELEIDQGYSGPCRAKITEDFFADPGDIPAVSITQFFPKGHMIGYAWALSVAADGCNLCKASARTWPIPPTLHDEITIGGAVTIDNGSISTTLPATDPVGLPTPGTLITKDVDVERWRFGVFFRRVTEIYVPG